jgi:hypothetical protein
MFRVLAYRSGCGPSLEICTLFQRYMNSATEFTMFGRSEDFPRHEWSTLPQIYFDGHLISDRSRMSGIINFIRKHGAEWANTHTEELRGLLITRGMRVKDIYKLVLALEPIVKSKEYSSSIAW